MTLRSEAHAIDQDEAVPAPGSGPKRRFTVEDAPPELQDNFMLRYFASLTAEQQAEADATFARRIEAAERYGDDADRELADIETGLHPLQRTPATG